MAFHINPETGDTGKCRAEKGGCPFGGSDQHYDTPAEAAKAFEAYFEQQVAAPVAKSAPPAPTVQATAAAPSGMVPGFGLAKLKTARSEEADALEALRSATDKDDRLAKHTAYQAAAAAAKEAQAEIERAGLGHTIPDDGPTLRVMNMAQKIAFAENMQGQISDGHWENLEMKDWQNGGQPHWMIWADANVIVDPTNPGRNFRAGKDNYQLNSSDLVDAVGDEIVDTAKLEPGHSSYDRAQLRKDLAQLSKMFKTVRPDHDAKAASRNAAPVKLATPDELNAKAQARAAVKAEAERKDAERAAAAQTAYATALRRLTVNQPDHSDKAMIGAAMASAGRSKPTQRLFTLNVGDLANPTTGEGDDYDHIKSGGVIIVGKADGTRARVIAGGAEAFDNPADELGRSVSQTKQRHTGRDAVTDGLYVLGYRDQAGNNYGWIPNKKLQYFVLK